MAWVVACAEAISRVRSPLELPVVPVTGACPQAPHERGVYRAAPRNWFVPPNHTARQSAAS